jgi:glucose-1-phosphate thymidylyltransferase
VNGPVLIVFVDTLFDADLGLIQTMPERDGIIWAKEVEDYQRFGVIVTDEDGHMQSIVEKPSEPISRLANIGLYYLRDWRLMFEGISHVMASPPKLGEYFLTDAFQYMIDHGARLFTAEVDHWWDCGKPETLLETNREVLLAGAQRNPAPANGVVVVPPVCVDPKAVLEDVEVGPNVSIGAGTTVRGGRLSDCLVGEHSTLEGCDLHDSLVGDHVRARGLGGTVSLGDHTVVDSLD